jgi:hypothetical protein
MARNKEPVLLEALAMEALCTYMSQQCRRVVEIAHEAAGGECDVSQGDGGERDGSQGEGGECDGSQSEGVADQKRKERAQSCVTAICDRLRELLHLYVPTTLANEVILAILKRVDDTHMQLMKYAEIPQGRLTVLRKFVAAVLHSAVNTLDFSWRWKHIADYVLCELQSLPNLRTLKFTYHKVCDTVITSHHCILLHNTGLFRSVDHISIGRCLAHLEHLTFEHECSDEMLQGLSETCFQLQTLDVNGSSRVTDVSVEYIKKFKHLKFLNLKKTKIEREGERNILSYFRDSRPYPMEVYGCTDIDNDHLNTLFDLVPDIRELRTASFNVRVSGSINDLVPYLHAIINRPRGVTVALADAKKKVHTCGTFQNLKILRIDFSGDNFPFEHFAQFVPHLQELEITGSSIRPTDIMRNWPKLNKLFLRAYSIEVLDTRHEICASLQHLTLLTLSERDAATLLSCCRQLRKLELVTHNEFYVSDGRILNEMPNIKEVSLGSLGGHVPPELVTSLSGRCSTNVLLEDAQLASLYQHCPEVRVDTDRWFEITKPGMSEVLVHNRGGTCRRKLFCYRRAPRRRDDDDDTADVRPYFRMDSFRLRERERRRRERRLAGGIPQSCYLV